jgi:hypothetical protein
MKAFFDEEIKGRPYTFLIIGKESAMDMKVLEKLGTVKKVSKFVQENAGIAGRRALGYFTSFQCSSCELGGRNCAKTRLPSREGFKFSPAIVPRPREALRAFSLPSLFQAAEKVREELREDALA